MMRNIFLSEFTREDRTGAIAEIEKIINPFGFIIDFKPFSDISLSLVIEAQESNIDPLYDALTRYLHMEDFERLNSTSPQERTIYLSVTFTNAMGNLKNEIPAVPG